MPVYRFRGIEEMKRHKLKRDATLEDRIAEVWARSSMWVEIPPPRGLRKFHNIEEANQDQEAWSNERIQLLRERRKQP